jgi:PBSX family phage terminase large subunit
MNDVLIQKLAKQEFQMREEAKPINVLQECFTQQLEFINSDAKRKILCIPRRSGKSTAVAIYLVHMAIIHPGCKLIYVNTTKGEAKNVMWHDIFENIFIRLGIKAELIDSKNEIRFENGSIVYLHGVDATPKEMNKLRGKKFALAAIDECQSYTQDLKQLILQVLTPTLADTNATICLTGTPGNQMGEHYWWILNRPDTPEKGWNYFHWTWKDNPFVRDNMQKQVDRMLADNPLIAQTPWFRQEYLGEWVPEADARVYKSTEINYIESLPDHFLKEATYLLSLDLGYHDATAYVVSAYNKRFNDKLYILESAKHTKLTITAAAQLIKDYQRRYKFRSIYVDAANLQAVEEMRQIHNLPLQAAEKQGKEAHIALMNSDFITQNLFVLKQTNPQLINELNTLIWDVKALLKGKHTEDATKENHLTDAMLYAHHGSRHYWYKPRDIPPELEEQVLIDIERQFGRKDLKGKTLKKPFWENSDDL